MKARLRKRSIDGDIQDMIETKALDGWGASQIHRHLEEELKKEGRNRWPPHARTIQRIVKEVVVTDTSGEWSIADSEGEDARLVLDTLAYILSTDPLIQLSSKRRFTRAEAQWIIRLRKVAPDAPAKVIWLLSQLYIRKERKGITDTADLDSYLAFTPWKGRDCYRLYKRVVAKGWALKPPLWYSLVEGIVPVGPEDPRFDENEDAIKDFEQDIYERSEEGIAPDGIADIFDIHPEDVEDIILKKGATQ